MRFATNPQLILTKDEFDTLNKAYQLCYDMDEYTSEKSCSKCPFDEKCSRRCFDCMYTQAQEALKQIIDIAIVK
jgi:hypothetical protein